jgi:hypothetical protein
MRAFCNEGFQVQHIGHGKVAGILAVSSHFVQRVDAGMRFSYGFDLTWFYRLYRFTLMLGGGMSSGL